MSQRYLRTAALTALATLAAAAPAAAHGDPQPRAAASGAALQLHGCLMTVALVPRPASALREALPSPPDLTRTFYGPDPLLAVWGLSCDGARIAGAPAGRVVLSALAVPTALTDPRAVPLANNFAHRLVRIDTGSRVVAAALRHRGLPARLARGARYAHSPREAVPTAADLVVPGEYRLRASAVTLDQPHDHVNRFDHRDRAGRVTALALRTTGAQDRFCFPAAGGCSASISATPGSAVARLLGGTSAPVLAAFDHRRIARIDLSLQGLRTRRTGG
jgi:hypothetical protein